MPTKALLSIAGMSVCSSNASAKTKPPTSRAFQSTLKTSHTYHPKHARQLRRTKTVNDYEEWKFDYVPCFHPNMKCDKDCPCVANRGFCDKWCHCIDNCFFRYKGCLCKKGKCDKKSCNCNNFSQCCTAECSNSVIRLQIRCTAMHESSIHSKPMQV